jgi:hypothetical protein
LSRGKTGNRIIRPGYGCQKASKVIKHTQKQKQSLVRGVEKEPTMC